MDTRSRPELMDERAAGAYQGGKQPVIAGDMTQAADVPECKHIGSYVYAKAGSICVHHHRKKKVPVNYATSSFVFLLLTFLRPF
jgi:hypothetical protein